jgi:hypothetical protein
LKSALAEAEQLPITLPFDGHALLGIVNKPSGE